jgi:ABC-type amino acid transport substrate-binding protein
MKRHIFTILLSAAVASGIVLYATRTAENGTAPHVIVKESADDRVKRTGTLRIGYVLYPPFVVRDLNTGKLSGIYVELIDEIAKQLSLKPDWAEEVSFAASFEGLKAGRYEVIAAPFAPTPGRSRAAEFTTPNSFIPYYAYVRADDARFDNNLQKINDPAVKVVVLEGEISQTVQQQDFPKAGILTIPSLNDISQVLLQVEMGKADVAMTEPASAQGFITSNPGKVRRVAGPPLRMYPISIAVPTGEHELKSMLNTTIETLLGTGYIARLYAKYASGPDQFFMPAPTAGEPIKPLGGQQP